MPPSSRAMTAVRKARPEPAVIPKAPASLLLRSTAKTHYANAQTRAPVDRELYASRAHATSVSQGRSSRAGSFRQARTPSTFTATACSAPRPRLCAGCARLSRGSRSGTVSPRTKSAEATLRRVGVHLLACGVQPRANPARCGEARHRSHKPGRFVENLHLTFGVHE
jgi:hypothetical protein